MKILIDAGNRGGAMTQIKEQQPATPEQLMILSRLALIRDRLWHCQVDIGRLKEEQGILIDRLEKLRGIEP